MCLLREQEQSAVAIPDGQTSSYSSAQRQKPLRVLLNPLSVIVTYVYIYPRIEAASKRRKKGSTLPATHSVGFPGAERMVRLLFQKSERRGVQLEQLRRGYLDSNMPF